MTANPIKKRARSESWLNEESIAGYVFSLPFIIGFLMFMLIPMALSLYYSFCKYDIQTPPEFVGLNNYIRIFTIMRRAPSDFTVPSITCLPSSAVPSPSPFCGAACSNPPVPSMPSSPTSSLPWQVLTGSVRAQPSGF